MEPYFEQRSSLLHCETVPIWNYLDYKWSMYADGLYPYDDVRGFLFILLKYLKKISPLNIFFINPTTNFIIWNFIYCSRFIGSYKFM